MARWTNSAPTQTDLLTPLDSLTDPQRHGHNSAARSRTSTSSRGGFLWPVDAARIKAGQRVAPFLDPANDARLHAPSRGETANRPFLVLLHSFPVARQGCQKARCCRRDARRRVRADQSLGKKGSQTARPLGRSWREGGLGARPPALLVLHK